MVATRCLQLHGIQFKWITCCNSIRSAKYLKATLPLLYAASLGDIGGGLIKERQTIR